MRHDDLVAAVLTQLVGMHGVRHHLPLHGLLELVDREALGDRVHGIVVLQLRRDLEGEHAGILALRELRWLHEVLVLRVADPGEEGLEPIVGNRAPRLRVDRVAVLLAGAVGAGERQLILLLGRDADAHALLRALGAEVELLGVEEDAQQVARGLRDRDLRLHAPGLEDEAAAQRALRAVGVVRQLLHAEA